MIEQKVEVATQQDFTLAGCLKQVEKAGRICYNSESKITDDSYKEFTERLIRNKHYSPFGHGTFLIDLIKLQKECPTLYKKFMDCLPRNYLRYYITLDKSVLVISARVLMEMSVIENSDDSLLFFEVISLFSDDSLLNCIAPGCKRITFKVTTSIDMTRELNTHKWSLDICEMSTRYVKMNSVIKPYNWDSLTSEQQQLWIASTNQAFENYNKLIELGIPKQEARKKLPLETVTEVYYTAFRHQWEDVIAKRTAKGVHPQMIDLMKLIKEKL